MTVLETTRRPWTETDKRDLMRFWESIGSIFLISVLMERPEGAIQTEASRLNLPRRAEDKGHHRKKWTAEEDRRLDDAVNLCRDDDGRIRITEVADTIGRSVDAVASKLVEKFESSRAMRDAIVIPQADLLAKAEAAAARPKATSDRRSMAMIRRCLCCERPFNSSGAGNRICKRCRSQDDSDWF
ncbi:hypothetical protein [Bosea sp. RAC05]|uniref:hypothetical protein n=1 Tax=Bosea sp. RAC05 TaxID=1842539 RepID=UPI00083CA8E1|nr:hypothetical protein [Bosea sp. RAC05]AOG03119.1 hypothetical protein BSY19_5281 [Bosea sp. RAC05]